MNKVILVGRIARDPELRTTNSGLSVCRFAVAVDRRNKNDGQATADFINVVAFGRPGEVISQYLGKGRRIALTGRLQTGSYVGNDGVKRFTTDVILEEFDFIDSKSQSSGGFNNGGFNNDFAAMPQNNVPLDMDEDFHLLADDDDVPF